MIWQTLQHANLHCQRKSKHCGCTSNDRIYDDWNTTETLRMDHIWYWHCYIYLDVFVYSMIWLYIYFHSFIFLFESIIIINYNNPINNGDQLQANMNTTNWEHECAILLGKALMLSTDVQIFCKWQEDKFGIVYKWKCCLNHTSNGCDSNIN